MSGKLSRTFVLAAAAALFCCAVSSPPVKAGDFTFQANDANGTTFEQRWNQPGTWVLNSGVDDGGNGIPDGTDTFVIDRAGTGRIDWGNTDLSNEGMPNPQSIAKITATGAPGRDIVLKYTADVTIGDLEVLVGTASFEIQMERDQDLLINGVISGAGDLQLTRSGGFSDVDPGEVITIGGTVPNTITGNIRLFNSNLDNPAEPAYFVADKMTAFGLTPQLTLEGRAGGNTTSLQLTANTYLGEGAIDDQTTTVRLGANAVLDVDAGVVEVVGSGKLLIDLAGTGTYTPVADGLYDNTAAWVSGAGQVLVLDIVAGDADRNDVVDIADLQALAGNFGGEGNWTAGDFDGDGLITIADLQLLAGNFGYDGTNPAAPVGISLGEALELTSVPEPTSVALIGLGGLALLRRCR